jgi:hypothetical protein
VELHIDVNILKYILPPSSVLNMEAVCFSTILVPNYKFTVLTTQTNNDIITSLRISYLIKFTCCSLSEVTISRMIRPWLHPEFIFRLSSAGKRYNECLALLHGFTNKVWSEVDY